MLRHLASSSEDFGRLDGAALARGSALGSSYTSPTRSLVRLCKKMPPTVVLVGTRGRAAGGLMRFELSLKFTRYILGAIISEQTVGASAPVAHL